MWRHLLCTAGQSCYGCDFNRKEGGMFFPSSGSFRKVGQSLSVSFHLNLDYTPKSEAAKCSKWRELPGGLGALAGNHGRTIAPEFALYNGSQKVCESEVISQQSCSGSMKT